MSSRFSFRNFGTHVLGRQMRNLAIDTDSISIDVKRKVEHSNEQRKKPTVAKTVSSVPDFVHDIYSTEERALRLATRYTGVELQAGGELKADIGVQREIALKCEMVYNRENDHIVYEAFRRTAEQMDTKNTFYMEPDDHTTQADIWYTGDDVGGVSIKHNSSSTEKYAQGIIHPDNLARDVRVVFSKKDNTFELKSTPSVKAVWGGGNSEGSETLKYKDNLCIVVVGINHSALYDADFASELRNNSWLQDGFDLGAMDNEFVETVLNKCPGAPNDKTQFGKKQINKNLKISFSNLFATAVYAIGFRRDRISKQHYSAFDITLRYLMSKLGNEWESSPQSLDEKHKTLVKHLGSLLKRSVFFYKSTSDLKNFMGTDETRNHYKQNLLPKITVELHNVFAKTLQFVFDIPANDAKKAMNLVVSGKSFRGIYQHNWHTSAFCLNYCDRDTIKDIIKTGPSKKSTKQMSKDKWYISSGASGNSKSRGQAYTTDFIEQVLNRSRKGQVFFSPRFKQQHTLGQFKYDIDDKQLKIFTTAAMQADSSIANALNITTITI